MSGPGYWLVVEDDEKVANVLRRVLERFRVTQVVATVQAAKALLATDARWTGLIVDIGLPDGSGFEVVMYARRAMPLVPILVLTGNHERDDINRAHQLRAEYLVKPAAGPELFGFLRRAVSLERVPNERVAWLVEELTQRLQLTAREAELIAAAVGNTPRSELREQFSITDNTLKTQIRQVLQKTGFESLDALAKAILRAALTGSDATLSAFTSEPPGH